MGIAILILGMVSPTATATTVEEMMEYMDDHVQHLRPWSWDHPARMVTVRGDAGDMTREQIDLVCKNIDVGGDVAFKEYYPGILSNIGYMNLAKDTRSYRLQGHYATHPEHYLYVDKNRKPRVGGSNAPYFNLANPDCREWWLSQAAEQIEGYECQGNSFFIDALAKVGGIVHGDIYDYWGNSVSDESYWDACRTLLDEVRDRFSDKVMIVGNFARPGTNDTRTQFTMDYTHIAFLESFEHFGRYVEHAHDAIALIKELSDAGKIVQVSCRSTNKPTPCPELTLKQMRAKAAAAMPEIWAEYNEEERDQLAASYAYFDFKVAYFLMGAGERCYMRFRDAKTLKTAGRDLFRIVFPYPIFDMDLGAPLEDAQRNGNVYTRKFEHVEVMVNFDNGTCEFNEQASDPDSDPPTPNPAQWQTPPHAVDDNTITMTAEAGTDANSPLAALPAADTPPPTAKPNIVFIYADDWGWGDLSCHGHEWLKTPNIDRLASEGMDFQQFNVLNPVCSPSRTAVITGKYPARFSMHAHLMGPTGNRNRNMPDWLDPKAAMLPRLFKQAGYRTGHFGKWHLTAGGVEGSPRPDAYGFDTVAVFNGGEGWPKAGNHDTAANTVAFIKENKGQPFFVNAWLHESHTAHVPREESMELWTHLDEQKQVYSAVITDGDKDVGAILDTLEEEGLADNTIVIFSSDNGPEWTHDDQKHKKKRDGYGSWASIGQTGGLRGKKRSLYEGGVRTPFIVRWPGHTPAGVTNNITVFTAVDLLPTLCAAAAVELPADFQGDGENLLPALQGKTITRTRPIFWEWRGTKPEPDWWPWFAVRDGDWKLLMTEDAKRVELHNLKTDRAEEAGKDLSKAHPEIVARLTKMALDWKATLPVKVDPNCVSPKRGAD